jgi:hypothetical protein
MTEGDELRVTAAVAVQRRDELVAEGKPELADYMNELACAAADLRDQRRALAHEVDEAINPFQALGEATCEPEPADPDRDERLARAVAEWQQGRAKPVMVRRFIGDEVPFKLVCPAEHSTSLRLLETSAGLLLVAHPPAERRGKPRTIDFATLLDGAGSYELGCRRCSRAYRLDLAAVRAAVLGRATMYRAT